MLNYLSEQVFILSCFAPSLLFSLAGSSHRLCTAPHGLQRRPGWSWGDGHGLTSLFPSTTSPASGIFLILSSPSGNRSISEMQGELAWRTCHLSPRHQQHSKCVMANLILVSCMDPWWQWLCAGQTPWEDEVLITWQVQLHSFLFLWSTHLFSGSSAQFLPMTLLQLPSHIIQLVCTSPLKLQSSNGKS